MKVYGLQYHHTNNQKILQVKTYKNDIVVGFCNPPVDNISDGQNIQRSGVVVSPSVFNKSEIKSFNKRSARHLKLLIRNTSLRLFAMVTLTYPREFVKDGRITKKHLNTFLQWLRDKYDIKYIWVSEFQTRGALHFHIAVSDFVPYLKLRQEWAGIVTGDRETYIRTEIKRINKSVENYFSQYLKKGSQKVVPDFFTGIGRFWGSSRGSLDVVSELRIKSDFQRLNSSLRTVKKWYQSKLRNLTRYNKYTGLVEKVGFRWKQNYGFVAWGAAALSGTIYNNLNLINEV